MHIDIGNVKGFDDYMPPVSLKVEKIKDISKKYFELYGFMPLQTPLVEYDELMKQEVLPFEEDSIISNRFKLKDRSGRSLALRYESAFQLSRIFKSDQNMKLPVRFYQIGPSFRDESLRAGRTRQFTLVDASIIGDSTQNAESELLCAISDILKNLNIDFEVHISNRRLIESVIDSIQIENKKIIIKELDNLNRIGEDLVKMNLKKYTDSNSILTLFKMLEKSIEFFTQNAFEGAEEVNSLLKLCNKNNVPVRFNPLIVRGFSYYTGNIFEIVSNKSTIAGGGRYDNVVGRFLDRKVPAVGVSFSIESILGLCPTAIEKIDVEINPKILVVSIDKESDSKRLIKLLRENNISCIMTNDKPGSSLEYANYYKIPYVIFLGKEEVEKQKFKFRDQKTGEEKNLTEKQLLSFFTKS